MTFENTLRDYSFTLTVTARNVGNEPLPLGIGWHSYLEGAAVRSRGGSSGDQL